MKISAKKNRRKTDLAAPLHIRGHDDNGWQHIGAVGDGVIHRIGRQAIAFHLSRAAKTNGREALDSLAEANGIRSSLGLSWGEYVAGLDVLAREAA